MVLMSDKNIDAYKKIFKNILEYIKSNFDREKFKLETFCTDYEEAMITAFKNIFEKVSDKLHYIGCYIHYLQACRRKLQTLHYTKKRNINIYNDYMDKFANFPFIKNITKKRILKEINTIENNYNINNEINVYNIIFFLFMDIY